MSCRKFYKGQVINNYTIIEEVESITYTYPSGETRKIRRVRARCSCGYEAIIRTTLLFGKNATSSCRRCAKIKDLTGQRFGRLVVLGDRRRHNNGEFTYQCKCDCGNTTYILGRALVQKNTKSCGCIRTNTGNEHFSWKGTGEISAMRWSGIKTAAEKRNFEFNITIEQAWKFFLKQDRKCALTKIYIEFPKQSKDTFTASLDRIDSSKGYTKDNIQWVHKDVNLMKWDMAQDRFFELCKLVSEKTNRNNK